jgi:hypothetical protein
MKVKDTLYGISHGTDKYCVLTRTQGALLFDSLEDDIPFDLQNEVLLPGSTADELEAIAAMYKNDND